MDAGAVDSNSSSSILNQSSILAGTGSNSSANGSTETESGTGTESTTNSTGTVDDFAAYMQQAIGKTGQQEVDEEELFAALIAERLKKDNEEASTFYKGELDKLHLQGMSFEDAGKAALKATVAAGKIELSAAEKIHAVAFKGAQLDKITDELFDGKGGPDDPTRAVAAMEAALLGARAVIEEIDAGKTQLEGRSLELASNTVASSKAKLGLGGSSAGSSLGGGIDTSKPGEVNSNNASDGKDGFLWKPVSDSNGKLAVLLPSSLAGLIDRVEIHTEVPPTEENKVEQGKFSANANGGRDHYRFSKPGGDYGDNVYVVAYRKGGGIETWKIEDSSKRID